MLNKIIDFLLTEINVSFRVKIPKVDIISDSAVRRLLKQLDTI